MKNALKKFGTALLLVVLVLAAGYVSRGIPFAMAQSVSNYFSAPSGAGSDNTLVIGGTWKVGSTTVSATGAELNQYVATLDIADLSTDATYYLVLPHAGTIDTIASVIDAAITTGDATITCNIAAVAITGGALTVATAASAAGDVDSVSPSAAKTVTAGQAVNCAVTGSNSATRAHLSFTVTR